MYYTGVDYSDAGEFDDSEPDSAMQASHTEAIGLAKSSGLGSWTFYDSASTNTGKLFDADNVSWLTWGDAEPWSNDCRDPFVYERFGSPSQLGMLVSAKLKPSRKMAIVYLHSVGPESPWYWQAPIDVTISDYEDHAVESATLIYKGGFTYLFWTEACHHEGYPHNSGLKAARAEGQGWDHDSFELISVDGLKNFACELIETSVGDVIFGTPTGSEIQFDLFDHTNLKIKPLTSCSL